MSFEIGTKSVSEGTIGKAQPILNVPAPAMHLIKLILWSSSNFAWMIFLMITFPTFEWFKQAIGVKYTTGTEEVEEELVIVGSKMCNMR